MPLYIAGNPSGFVEAEVLIKAMSTYGRENKLSRQQARELVSQLEVDENGLVNYKAFVDMILL